MKFSTFLLSLLFLSVCLLEVAGQNSWAAHLRRSAKRIASVKKSLISRGLAKKSALVKTASSPEGRNNQLPLKKSSSLVAAESGYGYFSHQHDDYESPARRDYAAPVYESPSCSGKPAGMIGNPAYNCKVFHICQADGRFDKMDCPSTLRFNNYLGVCDWPNKVDQYCNPIYYYSERPQREPYNYSIGKGPYIPNREHDMSYAAAERYSTRAKTEEEPGKEAGGTLDRKKEKDQGQKKKEYPYQPDLSRRINVGGGE